MASNGEAKINLGHKLEPAIVALLSQRKMEEAATAAGISNRTVLRWYKLPEFQTAYREARRAAYSQAVSKLQQGATADVPTLPNVMLDQGTPSFGESSGRRVRHESFLEGDRD